MTDLRAIAEAATPGPWAKFVVAGVYDDEGSVHVGPLSDADADHIASWSPDRAIAALDVIEAARVYADFSHGNITGQPYRDRREARDSLQDAIEAWEAL